MRDAPLPSDAASVMEAPAPIILTGESALPRNAVVITVPAATGQGVAHTATEAWLPPGYFAVLRQDIFSRKRLKMRFKPYVR